MAVDRIARIARYEAIIHDWTCGCGRGQACPNRKDCREAAEQIVAERLMADTAHVVLDIERRLHGEVYPEHVPQATAEQAWEAMQVSTARACLPPQVLDLIEDRSVPLPGDPLAPDEKQR